MYRIFVAMPALPRLRPAPRFNDIGQRFASASPRRVALEDRWSHFWATEGTPFSRMQTATDMVTIVLSRVPQQYGYASLPARLPHPCHLVITRRDYPLPIAAEHGAVDLSRVTAQFGYSLTRACLPHPGCAVRTGRDYPLPIAAEHGAVDLSRVTAQFGYSLTRACLPHPRAVLSSLAVTTHCPSGLNTALFTH